MNLLEARVHFKQGKNYRALRRHRQYDGEDEDGMDEVPLMFHGEDIEMDESESLMKQKRSRCPRLRTLGYYLSEGWWHVCCGDWTCRLDWLSPSKDSPLAG